MAGKSKDPPQQLVGKEADDSDSTQQITALIGGLLSGLQPIAEKNAQVQLAQIEAQREKEGRAFAFARTALFTTAGILSLVLLLLAGATAFLFNKGNDQAAMQVIWFAMGALSGFGFGRIGRSRQ
jgi:hypothetical protein